MQARAEAPQNIPQGCQPLPVRQGIPFAAQRGMVRNFTALNGFPFYRERESGGTKTGGLS